EARVERVDLARGGVVGAHLEVTRLLLHILLLLRRGGQRRNARQPQHRQQAQEFRHGFLLVGVARIGPVPWLTLDGRPGTVNRPRRCPRAAAPLPSPLNRAVRPHARPSCHVLAPVARRSGVATIRAAFTCVTATWRRATLVCVWHDGRAAALPRSF